jgi:60 kDa SS-A/Ro ribonucleoprotein
MKTVKENLKTINAYAGADTVNAEGFAAWTPSDTTLLEQLAMTGTLGNSFYANAKDATREAVALLERADAAELSAAIVKGRNEGFIRTFPILALVYLSKKDSQIFQETFNKVILTGGDLIDFIELAKSVRGLGRSIKKAISGWIKKNTTTYYAQKYRKQIADAIRLSRFKGEDSIYAYILNAYSGVKGVSTEKLEKAYAEYPDLAAHRDFVAAVESGDLRGAEALLRDRDIDVNSLTSYYGQFDKGLWAAVAVRSPVMRFVKYIAKFIREGVMTEELLKSKVNVDTLKKAKVFPFRLYTAYRAVERNLKGVGDWSATDDDMLEASTEHQNQKDMGDMVLKYLMKVIDEYAKTYDWSLFADAKWVVAPDVSGSMRSPIGGSSVLSYADVSAMFTGFFIKGLKDVTILPWDTKVRDYPYSTKDPVMKHIGAITEMVGGGTYMETGVKHMLRKGIAADYVVFLTDTEEYGEGWLAAWREYHRKYPEVVAFVLRGDSYMTSPIPEDEASRLNVYQIFGWNDSVMDYMKFVLSERKEVV